MIEYSLADTNMILALFISSMLWILLYSVSGIFNDVSFSLSFSLNPSLSSYFFSLFIPFRLCFFRIFFFHFSRTPSLFFSLKSIHSFSLCLLSWICSIFMNVMILSVCETEEFFYCIHFSSYSYLYVCLLFYCFRMPLFLFLCGNAIKFRTPEAMEFIIFHFLLLFPMTIDTILCDKHTWHNHGNQSLVTWLHTQCKKKYIRTLSESFSERNSQYIRVWTLWNLTRLNTMPNGCEFFWKDLKNAWIIFSSGGIKMKINSTLLSYCKRNISIHNKRWKRKMIQSFYSMLKVFIWHIRVHLFAECLSIRLWRGKRVEKCVENKQIDTMMNVISVLHFVLNCCLERWIFAQCIDSVQYELLSLSLENRDDKTHWEQRKEWKTEREF